MSPFLSFLFASAITSTADLSYYVVTWPRTENRKAILVALVPECRVHYRLTDLVPAPWSSDMPHVISNSLALLLICFLLPSCYDKTELQIPRTNGTLRATFVSMVSPGDQTQLPLQITQAITVTASAIPTVLGNQHLPASDWKPPGASPCLTRRWAIPGDQGLLRL